MATISLSLDTKKLAHQYELISETQYQAGLFLIEKLDISLGQYVLDVGAGTGRLTAFVAGLVGQDGRVVGIDPLKDRIDVACRKAKPNLLFALGDAQDLSQFNPASFDIVYLNSVFHWLADQPGALREFARILKPGGRLGILGGSGDHPPVYQDMKKRVLSRKPYKDYPECTQGFPEFPTPKGLEKLLVSAGFSGIATVLQPITTEHKDARDVMDWLEASFFGNLFGHLPNPLQMSARGEMEKGFEKFRSREGIQIDFMLLVAIAEIN